MTKFEDEEEPGFIAVTGELRRWCRGIPLSIGHPGTGIDKKEQADRQVASHCAYQTIPIRVFSDYRKVIVPYSSNIDFVGRYTIIQQLKEMLTPNHGLKRTADHVRVALYGLGGIG